MSKRHLSVLLKVAVSAGLIYLVFHKVAPDWSGCGEEMMAAFREGYGWLAAAVLVLGTAFLVIALRWRTILRGHDVNIGAGHALRLMMVGFFFGQFMPGGLAAGDAIRSYYIASRSGDKKLEAVATVILDRVIGSFGLVTLVGVSLLLGGEYLERCLMIIGIAAAVGAGAVLFFSKGVLRRLPFSRWIYEHLPYRVQLIRTYEAFRHYREHKAKLVFSWVLAVVAQFLIVTASYFVGRSVGVEATALQYLIRIPLVGVIAAIPISFGSIGTAELGYVVFFGSAAFALMMRLLWLFFGAVGGIIWWAEKGMISRKMFRHQKEAVGEISRDGADAR